MKKNILMFVTDEHRLSGIGAYGNTPCKTPNIDKLAENGVIFENNYTSCPLCSPARASFITGQHIHTHGLTANECEMGCGKRPYSGQSRPSRKKNAERRICLRI